MICCDSKELYHCHLLSKVYIMALAKICAIHLFQTLVDAPCPELASALGFQEKKAKELQETIQRVLDRREEERQSKELLQLYLKALEKGNTQQEEPSQPSQRGTTVSLCCGFHFYNVEMVILSKGLGHFFLALQSKEVA